MTPLSRDYAISRRGMVWLPADRIIVPENIRVGQKTMVAVPVVVRTGLRGAKDQY